MKNSECIFADTVCEKFNCDFCYLYNNFIKKKNPHVDVDFLMNVMLPINEPKFKLIYA